MNKTTGKIILGGCPRMLDFISSKKKKDNLKHYFFHLVARMAFLH